MSHFITKLDQINEIMFDKLVFRKKKTRKGDNRLDH